MDRPETTPPPQDAQPVPWQPRPAVDPRIFPHERPTPYHLMLRTWSYAWWKPVLGVLVAMLAMTVVMPLLLLPVLAVAVAVKGGPFLETFFAALSLTPVDAAALLYLNLVLGSMILVTWFVMRVVHRMRPRWLASVVPRMRWQFFWACLGLAVVAMVAQAAVASLLPVTGEESLGGAVNSFTVASAVTAAVVLLTTPLQAAGEEYLFRGYLLMAFGSWFGSRWAAIIATAALFAAAHGAQNFPLFFDRFAFGLIAGWLVTRTGGLEAGIALHILNNFLAFGLALTFGDLTDSLTVSEVGWWNIAVTLTQSAVYVALVLAVARRMALQTATAPPWDDPAGEGQQGPSTDRDPVGKPR
ncbi:MAG: type II CAAX endopeptidase family protein [Nocardioidaceae bacterium]